MAPTSIKFPPETLHALRVIACHETLRRGRITTWAQLVREVVQEHLIAPNAALAGVGTEVAR